MAEVNPFLPWHKAQWDLFSAYVQQQHIPHALLITGKKGLGKLQLARKFSQTLLCNQPTAQSSPCGTCNSCQLFQAKTHPDYISVMPEETGKVISIGQIRELVSRLTLKPQFEKYRAVVIDPAEKMNRSAVNGFLKCLEEPVERTVILMVCEQPGRLPATIRSRCQTMQINPPPQHMAIEWLKRQHIQGDLPQLLNLADTAPLLAKQYADQELPQLRMQFFSDWLKLSSGRASIIDVAGDWQQNADQQLFNWMSSWVMDLIYYRFQLKPYRSGNPDLEQPLKELAQQLELKCLFKFYDLLLTSKHRMNTQLNKQLLLEEVLIHWSKLNRKN